MTNFKASALSLFLIISSASAAGCYPAYSPGSAYTVGTSVSQSITTTTPLLWTSCAVGAGCPTGWTQTGGVATTATHNFACISKEYMINVYCGSLKNAFNSLSFYGILSEDDAQCFKVKASVEKASWILVSACLILCMLNHFISGASMQKTKDDEVPSDRRLHSDRWLSSKVVVTSGDGVAPVHTVTSLSEGSDEDEILDWIDYEKEPCVLPVKARFTDYYFFATARIDESDPVLATGVIPDSVINETGRSDSDSNGLSKLE